ncbi:plexin domain-containing protein 1-like [Cloeon dipterum]|uniref:plexin domain-containing protein 1-like n=1 Tax=Cloeon dipterum TaxID=197152 RepID=UPI0032202DB5
MKKEIDKTVLYMPDANTSLKVELPFDFKVYGHNVRKMEVLREGGIQSLDPNLNWDAIPLRIKSVDEFTQCPIRFLFDDLSLAIQWEFGYNNNCQNGTELSFQMSIHANGRIDFVYRKIPFGNLEDVADIFGVSFEFKVPGSNDTFDLGLQLQVNERNIKNNTSIVSVPMLLCPNYLNKSSCLVEARHANPPLLCHWCPSIGICSSRNDFLKGTWEEYGCDGEPPEPGIDTSVNTRYYKQSSGGGNVQIVQSHLQQGELDHKQTSVWPFS